MPAPHSVLLKGLTLGVDSLSAVPLFKQQLINTGTIHVAVVSGYNISLVVNTAKVFLGNKISVFHSLMYIIITLAYSVITGFEPPIVRAWLMSSICIIAKLSGRVLPGTRILMFTCLLMIVCDSTLLSSHSFILSTGATLGLFLYGECFKKILYKYVNIGINGLLDDLSASMAASVLVTPYIAYSFSRISIFSPIINMLLLWTIPYSTVLGFLCVFLSYIDLALNTVFAPPLFVIIFPYLDLFVKGINFFGRFSWVSRDIHISLAHLVIYYVVLFAFTFRGKKFLHP